MSDRRITVYIILITCLLFGLFTGRPFFFNLAYLLGTLLVLSFIWASLAVNWVRIGRQTRNRRGQVGRTLDEQFVVTNSGWLPKLWLEVRDHSTLPAHAASRVVPSLLPNGVYSWTVQTRCVVRGEFTLGPLSLSSGDPFGLFMFRKHLPATSKILVYPMVVPILDFAPPSGQISGGEARRQRVPFVTTNAAGVRQYSPGDSLNRVHWRTSARQDRLMVKEFELDPQADSWVVLDLSHGSLIERPYSITGSEGAGFIPPSSEEYAIVIASSIVQYYLAHERNLGIITFNPERFVSQPNRGHKQETRILEMLATARSENDITLKEMLALEDRNFTRGSTVTIITADMGASWVNEAHLLVRRGMRVITILLDPLSFGGEQTADAQSLTLGGGGVMTYVIRNGDDISAALTTPIYAIR
jgi:uncharacterized protein (DUF58 family)